MISRYIIVGSNSALAVEFSSFLSSLGVYLIGVSKSKNKNPYLSKTYTPFQFTKFVSGNNLTQADVLVYFAWQTPNRSEVGTETYQESQSLLDLQYYLNALSQKCYRKFVFISSAGAVYGNSSSINTEECQPMPLTQYGIEKVSAERMLCQEILAEKLLICRISNPYGFKTLPDSGIGFIDRAMHGIRQNHQVDVFGSGIVERDFIHLLNLNQSIYSLIQENTKGIFNIASGNSYKIIDVAKYMQSKFNCAIRYIQIDDSPIIKCSLSILKLEKIYKNVPINLFNWLDDAEI